MRNDTTTGRVSVCIRALVRYDFRAQNTGVKAHSGIYPVASVFEQLLPNQRAMPCASSARS